MKKLIFSLVVLVTIVFNANAQTVVINRPGLLTDLSNALIGVPAAAVTGFVEGTVEVVGSIISGGSTVVVASPAPIVVPQNQVVVTSPVVSWPSTSVVTTTPAPIAVPGGVFVPTPTTTIVTNYGNGVTTTVTREASGFELGSGVVYPVPPGNRVGSNPLANPYIFRPNGF